LKRRDQACIAHAPSEGIPTMPMSAAEIERRIKARLPDADVRLTDLAGDNDHWAAHVVSSAFKGLPRVRQHQLVYDAFGGEMGNVLHALQLTTAAPPE
jgi:stress-induced morphogen